MSDTTPPQRTSVQRSRGALGSLRKQPGVIIEADISIVCTATSALQHTFIDASSEMCGIFFSCSPVKYRQPSKHLLKCLERRGPDSVGKVTRTVNAKAGPRDLPWLLTVASSVLSFRSEKIVNQPIEDSEFQSDSFLCWNGEAWKFDSEPIRGYDAEHVFRRLLEAARTRRVSPDADTTSSESALQAVLDIINKVTGPYAFVFYDSLNQRVFYGRDALGRRSLLIKWSSDNSVEVASVRGEIDGQDWAEVDADGLYVLDLALNAPACSTVVPSMCEERLPAVLHVPWQIADSPKMSIYRLKSPFPHFNKETGCDSPFLAPFSPAVENLLQHLKSSLKLRLAAEPVDANRVRNRTRIAILFSGGLDCSVIARLAHDILPDEEEIDLLNVAFENPRSLQAAARSSHVASVADSTYELCPDRITGRSSYAELACLCPGRKWRFVTIDIPYSETRAHRSEIVTLLHPCNTEMDLSIGYALYFAARGSGTVQRPTSTDMALYSTSACILLSGLGADELFGGYARHATAFNRGGYASLVEQLELDFRRLGRRNLGRDDRVISHWGKEVRYPYLDEGLVSWSLGVPVWEKCSFGQMTEADPRLEPDKKVLRLLARQLGLQGPAANRKRAIQFGARSAKMEAGKTNGTQIIA
ncbi:MAG: hypothetical protein Q9217_006481 [Psora testacea]